MHLGKKTKCHTKNYILNDFIIRHSDQAILWTQKKTHDARGWRWEQLTTKKYKRIWGNRTVLSHDYGFGYTTLLLVKKAQNCTPQRVNFIAGIWKTTPPYIRLEHIGKWETIDTWPLARIISKHAKTPST